MKKIMFIFFLIMSSLFVQPIVFSQEMTREQCVQGVTPSLNVKDSLIMSAVTACIPGILEKVEQYRQIKCEEIVCKYEALSNGLDPTFCEKQSDYKQCNYVVGEAFAMPGFNFIEQVRSGVAQYLANPYLIVSQLARQYVDNCLGFECSQAVQSGLSFGLAISDLASVAQRITDMANNGFDSITGGSSENYCERIPEIEEEVDEILEATNY